MPSVCKAGRPRQTVLCSHRGRKSATLLLQCYTYLFKPLNTAPFNCAVVQTCYLSSSLPLCPHFQVISLLSSRLLQLKEMKEREQKPTGNVFRPTDRACRVKLYTLYSHSPMLKYTYTHMRTHTHSDIV